MPEFNWIDLVCCGNCSKFNQPDCEHIKKYGTADDPCWWCWNWKYDNLNNEKRDMKIEDVG